MTIRESGTENGEPRNRRHTWEHSLVRIKTPYLICTNICLYVDMNSHRFTEGSWAKDLSMHLRYLSHLTLACPVVYGAPPAGQVELKEEPIEGYMRIIALPVSINIRQECLHLPRTVMALCRAIKGNDIVHAVLVGGLIPYGWITTLLVRVWFRDRFTVAIIESAPWRLVRGQRHSLPRRIYSHVSEFINRQCLNGSDLRIFTHEEYRASLLARHAEYGYVIPASWVGEENIMSDDDAEQAWRLKMPPSGQPVRLLFVGRLTREKGVFVLLEALKLLYDFKHVLYCDILGNGPLFDRCVAMLRESPWAPNVRMLGTIPYDHGFFELLRRYHGVVIPSLSDEQPRLIYDAFSQALPVLASNTPGTRSCIEDGINGKLIELNNPTALAESLEWSTKNVGKLKQMGVANLAKARNHTHWTMHQMRWELLTKCLERRVRGLRKQSSWP